MKKYLLNAVLVVLMGFLLPTSAKSQNFEKVEGSKVKTEVQLARKFSESLLNAFKNNEVLVLKEESTELMKSTFTAEYQKVVRTQLQKEVGFYKSSEYVETWIEKSNPNFKIHRFKGDFTGTNKKVEIRTVLDEKNKVAGIYIKPWSDVLQ